MKKSILIILIVLLAFTVWSAMAFGKAKKDEGVKQSAEVQKAEPAPVEFPEVVLPNTHPVRPTVETFENILKEKKNKTPEEMKALQGEAVQVPVDLETQFQKSPYFCQVRNQQSPCCYYNPAGNAYLNCYGQIGWATLLNLDHNYYTDCPYPLYPFEVTNVLAQFYVYTEEDYVDIISEARI